MLNKINIKEEKIDSIRLLTESQIQDINHVINELKKLLPQKEVPKKIISYETFILLNSQIASLSALRDNVIERIIRAAKRGDDI